jgi:hypothetical protein
MVVGENIMALTAGWQVLCGEALWEVTLRAGGRCGLEGGRQ